MTNKERLAGLFRANYRKRVSAMALMRVGGWCSWRTRVSDLRRPPFNMRIEPETIQTPRGARSFYRYLGKKAA